MAMRTIYQLSLLQFLCLALWVPGLVQAEALKVGYTAISGSQAMLWVAHDAGIFKDLGLEVEIIYLAGPRATQALIAGEINEDRKSTRLNSSHT